MFKKLKAILKSEWAALDYIEIPDDKWYVDKELNELYASSTMEYLLPTVALRRTFIKNTEISKSYQKAR